MRPAGLLAFALLAAACSCPGGVPPEGVRRDGGGGGGGMADAGSDGGALPAADGGVDGGPDGGEDAGVFVDAGAPDAGVALSDYCDAWIGAYCDRLVGCGGMDPAQRQDCPLLHAWICTRDQLLGAVDAGRVAYDPPLAGDCVGELLSLPCGQSSLPSRCDAVFSAQTPLGGGCSRQWSGTCVGGFCQGSDCAATCAPYLPVDAGCSGAYGDECGLDAYCGGAPKRCLGKLDAGTSCVPNDVCKGGHCSPLSNTCVPFGSLGEDAGCVSEAECQVGLGCIEGACQPRRGIAEACRIYGGVQCQAAFTCRSFDGGLAGICWPRSDAGEGCYGVPEDCFDGLVCSSPSLFVEGQCLRFGSEDAGCDRTAQNCRAGLRCAEDDRCRRLPRPGERCVVDPLNFRGPDCLGGACLESDAGAFCHAALDAGQGCSRPWECSSSYCTGGSCAELCR